MRIYLDNCCFNRPFDEQKQIRVRLEAEAKLHIQSQIHETKIDLVWSYILEYENKFNPYTEKRNAILQWKQKAITHILENKAILNTAEKFILMNIRPKDALHIACAIVGKCDFFLTTDDAILAKKNRIKNIHILNPQLARVCCLS